MLRKAQNTKPKSSGNMNIQDRFTGKHPAYVFDDVVDLEDAELELYKGCGDAFLHVKNGEIISIQYIENDQDFNQCIQEASAYRDVGRRSFYTCILSCCQAMQFKNVTYKVAQMLYTARSLESGAEE